METRLLYGVHEAAKAAGIGTTKLREEIAANRLTARKVGKRIMISAADLDAWVSGLPRAALRRTEMRSAA